MVERAVKPPLGPQEAQADAELVSSVAAGNRAGLRTLFDRHAGRALALALRVLGVRADAEEVVQETFLEVWRRARDYDPARGAVGAWIASMARSRAIDRVRQRGAGQRLRERVAAEPPAQAEAAAPAAEVESRRERERVTAALQALPEEQRRVIELAYYEGRSQSEIATITGEPLGTVKSRVRLAMQKLAALLAEAEGGGA